MNAILTNVSPGPVELHLPAGVVVLGPRARIDCAETDLALGQIQALCRHGVLQSTADSEEDTVDTPDTPPARARRAPAKRGRSAQKSPPAKES